MSLTGIVDSDLTVAPDQPIAVEWHTDDSIYIRHVRIKLAGTMLPQHAHQFGHHTLLSHGAVRVWCETAVQYERLEAPAVIYIDAGVKHTFLALEDETVLACVHNLHGEEAVAVLAENSLVE